VKTPALTLLCSLLLVSLLHAENRPIIIGGLDGLDPWAEEAGYPVLLALSGGGIRGLAGIGALRAFEETGIRVVAIAGTSMGGVVGGLYAAGYSPAELEEIVHGLDFAALFQNTPPRATMLQTRRREHGRDLIRLRFEGLRPQIPQALTSAQYLTNVLTELTTQATYRSDGDFSRLRVPYAAVSTDIISGQQEVLRSGSLADAMRATMAFPLAFTGLEIDGKFLMDGGMVDPVPVDVVRDLSDSTDFVVAVNTASTLRSREELVTPLDIADQATTIMTAQRLRESLDEANFVLEPAPPGIQSTDYRFSDSLIALGYRAALAAADSLRRLLEQRVDHTEFTVASVAAATFSPEAQAIFRDALLNRPFTRAGLIRELKRLVRALDLFRLEAVLEPATGGGAPGEAVELRLNGFANFAPGAAAFLFFGNTRFDDSDMEETLALGDSAVTPASLRRGLDRILGRYAAAGWDLACIRRTSVDPDRARITIVIDEALVRDIAVDGVRRTRPWYVRAHCPLRSGEPYSTAQAAAGLKNIYGTDLFDRVTIDIRPSGGRPVVVIGVEEKAYPQVRLGWHWDDEYESEEFIELADDNLGGIGVEGLVHARYSPDRQDYHVGLRADRIFKTYLTSTISGYRTLLDRHLYDADDSLIGARRESKAGIEIRLGQQIARLGTVTAGLVVEQVEYSHEPDGSVESDFGLRILEIESMIETLDRVPFPRTGERIYLQLQQAGKLVGGDAEYTRFSGSLEAYFPLCGWLTYHPRAAAGLSRPALPWSEKFYLGGMHSLAGYRTHQLAGDQMLVLSQELRLALPLRFYLSLRYDVGDVHDALEEIRLSSVRHGAGISLALDAPIGPVEIGYGVSADDHEQLYLRAGFDF